MQVIKRSSVKKQEKRSKLKARLLPLLNICSFLLGTEAAGALVCRQADLQHQGTGA
jgi:hypothetical protein